MDTYRRWWARIALSLCALGVVLAFIALPPGGVIATAVLAGLAGVAVGGIALSHIEDGVVSPPSWRVLARAALIGALAVAGFSGGLTTDTAATFLLLALLAVTSPPVVRRLAPGIEHGAVAHRAPKSPAVETTERPAIDTARWRDRPLAALSTSELCWAWRVTFSAVHRSELVSERAVMAELRAELLDELDRRDPAAFRRWIASGARAASDPGRYLLTGDRRAVDPPASGAAEAA